MQVEKQSTERNEGTRHHVIVRQKREGKAEGGRRSAGRTGRVEIGKIL